VHAVATQTTLLRSPIHREASTIPQRHHVPSPVCTRAAHRSIDSPLPQQLTMMFSRARPRSRRCDTPPSDGTRACDAITARDAAPNAEWQYSILSPTSPPGHDRRAQARAWPDNVPHNHMLIKYIGLVFNPHENGSDRAQFVTRAFTLIKR
jgi:hypothetical protein